MKIRIANGYYYPYTNYNDVIHVDYNKKTFLFGTPWPNYFVECKFSSFCEAKCQNIKSNHIKRIQGGFLPPLDLNIPFPPHVPEHQFDLSHLDREEIDKNGSGSVSEDCFGDSVAKPSTSMEVEAMGLSEAAAQGSDSNAGDIANDTFGDELVDTIIMEIGRHFDSSKLDLDLLDLDCSDFVESCAKSCTGMELETSGISEPAAHATENESGILADHQERAQVPLQSPSISVLINKSWMEKTQKEQMMELFPTAGFFHIPFKYPDEQWYLQAKEEAAKKVAAKLHRYMKDDSKNKQDAESDYEEVEDDMEGFEEIVNMSSMMAPTQASGENSPLFIFVSQLPHCPVVDCSLYTEGMHNKCCYCPCSEKLKKWQKMIKLDEWISTCDGKTGLQKSFQGLVDHLERFAKQDAEIGLHELTLCYLKALYCNGLPNHENLKAKTSILHDKKTRLDQY